MTYCEDKVSVLPGLVPIPLGPAYGVPCEPDCSSVRPAARTARRTGLLRMRTDSWRSAFFVVFLRPNEKHRYVAIASRSRPGAPARPERRRRRFLGRFLLFRDGPLTWFRCHAVLLYAVWRRFGTRGLLWVVLFLGATVIADDQICNFFKHNVPKLRPTHTPGVESLVHTVRDYRGGLYGTVSAHAAISFSIALFTSVLFRRRWYAIAIFVWAAPAGVQPDLSGRALSDGYSVRSAARPVAGGRLGQALPEADATDGGGFPGII